MNQVEDNLRETSVLPFSDTPGQSPEGKGVGLAVVKMIVQKHEGRVWVESEPGAGTTFWVALPRAGRGIGV